MLSWLFDPNVLLGGLILGLLQFIAALPWFRSIDPRSFDKGFKDPSSVMFAVSMLLSLSLGFSWFFGHYSRGSASLYIYGRLYGIVLHLQLLLDFFLLLPLILTLLFPKIGAVAHAAYREAWRQPMFWLILVGGVLLIWVAVVIPYFTFGDDYKMMKQIGFDIIMLAGALFAVLAASISIREEIEGRTAITVISKPINRRSFMIGKYLGILMATAGLSLILGLNLNGALWAIPEFDPINKDNAEDKMALKSKGYIQPRVESLFADASMRTFAGGVASWFGEIYAHNFGIVLGFGQVMILLAIAVALATRMSFVINLVICLAIFFMGHLAPVIVRFTEELKRRNPDNTAYNMVGFLGSLFDTILPAFEFFSMGPAIIRDAPLELERFSRYVGMVSGYALIYTGIALIVGLLLFEDRDLA